MEKSHKMQGKQSGEGELYLDRMAALWAAGSKCQLAIEAARCKAMLSAAVPPVICGSEMGAAPARIGQFVPHRIRHKEGGSPEDLVETPIGYVRISPIRRADAFDGMVAAAARRDQPWPLTPGQIAIGRRYHDLVELLSADGTKLSSLQGGSGGPDGRDWMDRHLELSAEVEGMWRRIGIGPALGVRRIRPSRRGEAAPKIFTRRDLVDAVCLRGQSIKEALRAFGWQDNGRNCKAAVEALSAALDAMIGYGRQKSY